MPLRHSSEDLSGITVETQCSICQQTFATAQVTHTTKCGHTFHETCLEQWLRNRTDCPLCRGPLSLPLGARQAPTAAASMPRGARPKSQRPGVKTRGMRSDEVDIRDFDLQAESGAEGLIQPPGPSSKASPISDVQSEAAGVRSIVHQELGGLQQQISDLQSGMRAMLERMAQLSLPSRTGNAESPKLNPRAQSFVPVQRSYSPRTPRGNNVHFHHDKVASIIGGWGLKFSGRESTVPVEVFINRVAALTRNTLGGNFNILCQHMHLLLIGPAADWFWRFYNTRRDFSWRDLESALSDHFADRFTDADLMEQIRNRKQRPNETFDDFSAAIYKLDDRLQRPVADADLADMLRRNLLPDIRRGLLQIHLPLVRLLRQAVIREENFEMELGGQRRPSQWRNAAEELHEEDQLDQFENSTEEHGVEAVAVLPTCWNCGYDRAECLRKVESYCPETNTWVTGFNMIEARGRVQIATVKGIVYAVGGSNGTTELDTVESLKPGVEKWKKCSSLPLARSNAGVCALDDKLYCIGGWNGQSGIKQCDVYSPEENKWSSLAPLNTGRYQAGVTAFNGKLWAVGGSDAWNCLGSVEVYNPEHDQWTFSSPLITPRRGCGLAAFQGKLYAVGGSDGTQSLNSTEIFDEETKNWVLGPTLITPRSNVSVVVVQNKLYAIGGFSGKSFLNTMEFLDPSTNEWTTFVPHQPDTAKITKALLSQKSIVENGSHSSSANPQSPTNGVNGVNDHHHNDAKNAMLANGNYESKWKSDCSNEQKTAFFKSNTTCSSMKTSISSLSLTTSSSSFCQENGLNGINSDIHLQDDVCTVNQSDSDN